MVEAGESLDFALAFIAFNKCMKTLPWKVTCKLREYGFSAIHGRLLIVKEGGIIAEIEVEAGLIFLQ